MTNIINFQKLPKKKPPTVHFFGRTSIFAVLLKIFNFLKKVLSLGLSPLHAWLPVLGLTCAAFVFNTSEFIPIGLLSDIARDFETSEATAGMLITVYAWVVAVASLPLMLLVARFEYRKLLLAIVALFAVSHLLSAVSSSYATLMISRIGVACSHAIFWSITSPLAVRVAPRGRGAAALGIIVTGTSVAMIAGLPLGRIVGLHAGWRMTFLYIAIAAALVLLLLARIFPKVRSDNTISLRGVPRLLEKPELLGTYLLTLLIVTAHYTGYSYIEPFLKQVAGMEDDEVTLLLTLFGAVGIVGSILFSRCYRRAPRQFVLGAVGGITAALFLLQPVSASPVTTVMLCLVWGLAITVYNLVFQSEIIRFAPQSTAVAMSVYSGIFNLGIGSGALLGGFVCSGLSIAWIGYVGGAIALVAGTFCLRWLLPRILRNE